MDDIKDIQASSFLKLLDAEVRVNPFGENRSGERAYRRAERIVGAIFLVTNHIPQGEPLRNSVRSNAIVLLEQVLFLRDEMRVTGASKFNELQADLRRLISQVRMLVFAGFVSAYNADAVAGALDDLGNFISLAQRSNLSESVRISREELLDVRDFSKGHLRDIRDRKIIRDKTPVKDNSTTTVKTQAQAQDRLSTRAAGIMDALRTGGELSIRDIAAQVPEYGEKTIQRELNLLISRGSVRRIGLKRWSRYTLTS